MTSWKSARPVRKKANYIFINNLVCRRAENSSGVNGIAMFKSADAATHYTCPVSLSSTHLQPVRHMTDSPKYKQRARFPSPGYFRFPSIRGLTRISLHL